jgi:hypothetical protein
MPLSLHHLSAKPDAAYRAPTTGFAPETARLVALDGGDAFGLLWPSAAKIFSAATGALRDGPRLTREALYLPVLSSDGALIAEYEVYFGVRVFNFATRRLLRSYFPNGGGIGFLAFAPGTRILVSSNVQRTARPVTSALDLSDLSKEAPAEARRDRVLETDPAARALSTGSPDDLTFRVGAPELITFSRGELRRVSLLSGKRVEGAHLGRWSTPSAAKGARLGTKGGYAVVRNERGLAFWRLDAPRRQPAILYRQTAFPKTASLSFHPAGRLLWASGGVATLSPAERDEELRVWKTREGISSAVFLPDSEHVLIVAGRELLVCHPEYDRPLASWEAPAEIASWALAGTGLLAVADKGRALHLLVVEGYRAPHAIDGYWDGWAPRGW